MLSTKAKAVADKIKSFDEDDVHSLSEVIRHEVEHATDELSKRARVAEDRIRQFTSKASGNINSAGKRAYRAIDNNPVPSTLAALAVGFVLGALLMRRETE